MIRSLGWLAILSALLATPAHSQIVMRPTPPPQVTADDEAWYLSREPLFLDGQVYYPTGPVMHFHTGEMVRTGWVGGVPIYIRTTHEPRSLIYIPLTGGLVRPYERRRDGDLAGTVGSTAPSFPVVLPSAERLDPDPRRAPSPPTTHPASALGVVRGEAGRPGFAGTTGLAPAVPPVAPAPLQSARLPEGLNAVFVDYDGRRWFAAGHVVGFDAVRFHEIGGYQGFTVFAERGHPGVIYVPVVDGPPGLVTPYRLR
jgi:hypothetical protein